MNGEIVKTETWLLGIDLPKPFPLGFGTLSSVPRVLYAITAKVGATAIQGVGEASIDFPFSNYDAWDIYSALDQVDLVGKNIDSRDSILTDPTLRQAVLQPFPAAFTALNMALDDLWGRVGAVSLSSLYGSCRLAGQAVVSLPFFATAEQLVQEVIEYASRNVVVKPKVGQGIAMDERAIAALCQYLATKNRHCILDFNASYTVSEFTTLIDNLLQRKILWSVLVCLEQPTSKEEGIEGLAAVREHLIRRGVAVPVMADESFTTVTDAEACHARGLLLNFKIHKIGGIYVAREIEQALGDETLTTMIGGTFPTAIGRVYDQHAACVLKSAVLPADGWEPSTDWFTGDKHFIVESFPQLPDGRYAALAGSGSGSTVNWDHIRKFVIPDPRAEYQRIRQGKAGTILRMQLKAGQTYQQHYQNISGRKADWNL